MNNIYFNLVLGSVWMIIFFYVFYLQKRDKNLNSYLIIKTCIILIIVFLLINIFYLF